MILEDSIPDLRDSREDKRSEGDCLFLFEEWECERNVPLADDITPRPIDGNKEQFFELGYSWYVPRDDVEDVSTRSTEIFKTQTSARSLGPFL